MENKLNIFITGGMTGAAREASRQLVARGHRVTVLTQGSEGATLARQDGAIPAFSDLLRVGEMKSMLQMSSADVVLYFATQAANSFPSRDGGYEALQSILTDGVHNLVEAAKASSVKFIVYVSSTAVYGDLHGAEADETTEGHDEDGNFRRMRLAERQILESGISACVLRAGFNYSSDDAPIQALSQALRHGRGLYLADSHSHHNWIHAADLASAAVLAAEQQPAGQIINVVDDQPVSAASFAASFASALGLGVSDNSNMPLFMLRIMTHEMQRALLATSAKLSNAKARQLLGWSPRYPTHQAGLEQVLLVWRAGEIIKAT